MAKLNFSLPDDVKQEFNTVFAKENKSALLTSLIVEAIEKRKQQERRKAAGERILAMRASAPAISDDEIRAIREELRQ